MPERPPETDATRPDALEDARADHLRVLVLAEGISQSAWVRRGRSVTIGRASRCGIRVDHPSVSREHAELVATSPPTIRDLGSFNGVRLRGHRISPETAIAFGGGEVVQLGSVIIVVQDSAGTLTPAPLPAPTSSAADDEGEAVDALIDLVAPSELHVLLLGETGVGKGVTAEKLHARSSRSRGPFVRINCAALPEALLEGELFGFERGAFSGAAQAKPGLLEAADGGTAFLDEIGEMPLTTQAKLLGVLDTNEVQRLGSLRPRRVDLRWLAATNRNLDAAVAGGTFRADLFHRLAGIRIALPPLRARKAAICELAATFAREASERIGRPSPPFSPEASAWLVAHPWPGNIRELRNAVERACVLARGGRIDVAHLAGGGSAAPAAPVAAPPAAPSAPTPAGTRALQGELDALERRRIEEALAAVHGNQTRAAERLGMSRRALINRLDAFGLPRPRKR